MGNKRLYSALFVIVLIVIATGCAGKEQSSKELASNSTSSEVKITLAKQFKYDNKKTTAYVEGLQASKEFPISVTNAFYYTYGMNALSRNITAVQKERLSKFISVSQKKDGGIAFDKVNESDLFDTYAAVWTLKKLNALGRINITKVEDFIKSHANKDGGFSYAKGQESRPIDTYCCIASLDVLGKLSDYDKKRTVGYLKTLQGKDGGFALRPGITGNAQSTFNVLQSLKLLDSLDVVDKNETVAFLQKDQCKRDGGFSYMPGEPVMSLPENTYYAVSSLHLLEALDKLKVDQLSNYMRDHYTEEGGFCDLYSGNSKYPSTFYGIATMVELGYFKSP